MTITTARPKDQLSPVELPDAIELQDIDVCEDQPDPVTLCHPVHDGDGLLRWASATFDMSR